MVALSTATVADTLLATPPLLRTLLEQSSAELLAWKADETTWSIAEVIGHLIAADRVAFADRIEQMLTQDHPNLSRFDVHQLARERQDQLRSLADLLTELADRRQQYVLLVRSLTPAQMARTGHHVRHGDFRVSDFVYEWAYHDHAHLQQIMEILKRSIWPRFSPAMQQALDG